MVNDIADNDCGGCSCNEHVCRPEIYLDGSTFCHYYCRSCEVRFSANDIDGQADWLLERLQAIAMVNPRLLIDIIKGDITFKDANHAAIEADPIVATIQGSQQ